MEFIDDTTTKAEDYPAVSPVETKPVGETLAKYAEIFGLRDVSVIQQYSMRSYQTGLYDVLTDGNAASMSRILFDLVKFSKKLKNPIRNITFMVPDRESVKGGIGSLDALETRLRNITGVNIVLEEYEYGANAKENREFLDNLALLPNELSISYFRHDLSGEHLKPHLAFICPGSPRKENPLYSMDEFEYFEDAIGYADITFFYNKNQAIYGSGRRQYEASAVTFEINPNSNINDPLPKFHFYFPYRLTDKDYMFEEFLHEIPSGSIVAVTDPNESLGSLKPLEVVQSTVNPGVTLLKMDPSRHLDIVRSIIEENAQARKKDTSSRFTTPRKIVITSKLNKTLHMGPVEMFSIAKNSSSSELEHFKYVRNGTNEFFFTEESKRALGRT